MAERRMFAKSIIDSDLFLDMPVTARLLYYDLSMRADDDGFVDSPKKIMRMIGASQDDFTILAARQFIIPFDNGIVVIKHWRIHNYIRKDRYEETKYKSEKDMLRLDVNKAYTLDDTNGRPLVDQRLPQDRLGKVNKEKDITNVISKEKVDSRPRNVFKPPTVDEVRAYCIERHNNVDPEAFVDFYESKGWMVGKNKMRSWKAAVRTWERSRNNQQGSHIQTQEEFEAELKKFMEAEGIE